MGLSLSSFIFQPPKLSYAGAKNNRNIRWLTTKSGASIPAFYIDRKSEISFLFSHGNAEDIGMIFEWLCELSLEINVNILAYDYEGYGKATGRPSEISCFEDIDAAYKYLTETLNQSSQNIIFYGRSLGSGPSCYLAEKLCKEGIEIGGLILQSALLSVYRVAFNFRFSFPGDMFCNIDRIGNITCPILLIHGTHDDIVPFWNGEMLFLAAPVKWRAKPIWVDGGEHNNIEEKLRESGLFFGMVEEFLNDWVPIYYNSIED